MEKAIFPLRYMNVTQGIDGAYSHKGTLAIDFGNSGVKEKLYAPFTGTIKKVYTYSGNFVWLESNEPVYWADGTIDYMTFLTGHYNDVSDLYVGKVIKQGEVYYEQGNAGNATGIHTHLEVGKGKFTGTGWFKNQYDIWMINNAVHPAKALFVTKDTRVIDDGGYNFKGDIIEPVPLDSNKDQIEVIVDNLRIRKEPNGEILDFLMPGVYDILATKDDTNYKWYSIGENLWIAYDPSWAILHLKNNDCTAKIASLEAQIVTLKEENAKLNNFVKVFSAPKDDIYAIKLIKGEEVYIVKQQ